jgi:hypothetical protein
MKTILTLAALTACGIASLHAKNPEKNPVTPAPAVEESDLCCHHLSNPFGVMFDHTHPQGTWMAGYRYFYSTSSGLRQGTEDISEHDLFAQDYTSAPVEMTMNMHMLEIMYSPTDWLTLMVMPMYMDMEMTMRHGGMHHEEEGHHAAEESHSAHGGKGSHKHSTSGWGDTNVSAIFRLWNGGHQSLLGTFGISIPTGSVDLKGADGRFTHYMMQLGSGTWDFTPSITYLGHSGSVFWGAQYLAAIRLEGENESGYRMGDAHQGTAWAGVNLTDWVSLTGRVLYRHEGKYSGHYNGPHNHASPPDLIGNYGSETLDLGVGLNFAVFKGARLGVEALFPVYQNLDGIQLKRDFTLAAGLQYTF